MDTSKLNIEQRWDYAMELLSEISSLISSLPETKFLSSNKFLEIHKKIEKAKTLGINVQKYEEEIKNFRCNLLKRKILDKISEIQSKYQEADFDTSVLEYEHLENSFLELKDDFSDITEIENVYYELKNIIKKAKLYRKLSGLQEWEVCYDLDQVLGEILNLKEAGINVSDLEDIIYWE